MGHYALRISRLDSTRSIKGRMPSLLEIARDSFSRVTALARSPSATLGGQAEPVQGYC